MAAKHGGQMTFQTMGGDTVTAPIRGKHYVQPRGYVAKPGTGPVGETCGSCAHHIVKSMGKRYHKCDLARGKWTGGRGSDILTSAAACEKFEKENL